MSSSFNQHEQNSFPDISKFLVSLAYECTQVQKKISSGSNPMKIKEIKTKTCFTTYKDDSSLNPSLYFGFIGEGGASLKEEMESTGITLQVTLSSKKL